MDVFIIILLFFFAWKIIFILWMDYIFQLVCRFQGEQNHRPLSFTTNIISSMCQTPANRGLLQSVKWLKFKDNGILSLGLLVVSSNTEIDRYCRKWRLEFKIEINKDPIEFRSPCSIYWSCCSGCFLFYILEEYKLAVGAAIVYKTGIAKIK